MSDRDLVADAIIGVQHNASGWARIECPLCARTGKRDRKRSLGVHASGRYRCFRCGAWGRIDLDGSAPPPQAPPPATDAELGAPEGFVPMTSADGLGALCLAPARAYLRRRGVTRRIAAEAGIGACATGRLAGRVVVPVIDDGRWRGWVARSWGPSDRPYLTATRMPRAEVFFNGRILDEESDAPALVVEGVFDALALWPAACAVLGKPSHWQIGALAAAPRPVVIVLDGDAHEQGWALAMRLRLEGQRAASVRLPPKTDPDEVPRAWLDAEIATALRSA